MKKISLLEALKSGKIRLAESVHVGPFPRTYGGPLVCGESTRRVRRFRVKGDLMNAMSRSVLRSAALLCPIVVLFSVSSAWAASLVADAAESADWRLVGELIEQGGDVNAAQADGTTALVWAAYHSHAATAEFLLAAGADVHAKNRLGMSALSMAAENRSGEIVDMLLEAGADANAAMPEGDTALMLASRSGDLTAVEALLAHGADVNAVETFHGETALMWAAAGNHADVVRVLAEHGADLDAVSTEFTWDDLTQTGVSSYLPRGGLTALIHAAREDAPDAARILLELGASPHVANPVGISAMRIATTNGHLDVAKLLLDHGADAKDGTLVELARLRGLPMVRPAKDRSDAIDSLGLAKALLDQGADMHQAPEEGMTNQAWTLGAFRNDPALFIAAREADLELIKLFGEHGADPDQATNKDGATVLMAALGFVYHQLGGGVPTAPRDTGLAVAVGDAVFALGTDVDAQKDDGMTVLHMAAEQGRDDLVQYLLDHNARLDIKDQSNRMPIDVANAVVAVKREGEMPPPMPPPPPVRHDSTVKLLREAMAAAGVAEEVYVAPDPLPAKEEAGEAAEEATDEVSDVAISTDDASASLASPGQVTSQTAAMLAQR